GITPGEANVLEVGGLNPKMNNANVEGGPRNGVMTAIDDFIAEHDRPIRRLVIPIYFGLAILVEDQRLDGQPQLPDALSPLEEHDGQRQLLEVAEETRLKAMLHQHNLVYRFQEKANRAAQRYLGLLKGALLDEHYLENEIRIAYLTSCARNGNPPDADRVRD